MDDMNTQTPAAIHTEVIRAGIEKAKDGDIQAALSVDVFQSLASLKSAPDTLGAYLSLLEQLVKSHKAIRKGDIEKAVIALLPEDEKDTAGWVNAADEIVTLVTNACTLFTDQETKHTPLSSKTVAVRCGLSIQARSRIGSPD